MITHLFIIILGIQPSFADNIDYLLTKMSEGSYYLSGGESCSTYDTKKLAKSFYEDECSSNKDISGQKKIDQAANFFGSLESHVEDQFILRLAHQESKEISCSMKYTDQLLESTSASRLSREAIEKNIYRLIITRARLGELSYKLSQDSKIQTKICPITLQELKRKEKEPGKNPKYIDICRKILKQRIARDLIIGTIPLAHLNGPIKEMLQTVNFKDKSNLQTLIKNSYKKMKDELREDKYKLESTIKNKGAKGFGRAERRLLMSDPRIVESLIKRSSAPKGMRDFACRMDARYGEGARKLDLHLGIGSLTIGGGSGLLAKVGRGAWAARGVASARAGGLFSASAARSLKVAGLSGVLAADGLLAVSEIRNACFNRLNLKRRYLSSKGSECLSSPDIKDTNNDQCILVTALNAVGLLSGGLGLLSLTKQQAKLRQLEKTKINQEAKSFVHDLENYEKLLKARRSQGLTKLERWNNRLDLEVDQLGDLFKRSRLNPKLVQEIKLKTKKISEILVKILKERGIPAGIRLSADHRSYQVILKDLDQTKHPVLKHLVPSQRTLKLKYTLDPILELEDTGGFFTKKNNTITLSFEHFNRLIKRPSKNILEAKRQMAYLLQLPRHEITHANLSKRLKEGRDGDYYASVLKPKDGGLSIYENSYSFEELSTYFKDIKVYEQLLRRSQKKAGLPIGPTELDLDLTEATQNAANILKKISQSAMNTSSEAMDIVNNKLSRSRITFEPQGINLLATIPLKKTGESIQVALVRKANIGSEKRIEELKKYLIRLNEVAKRRYLDASEVQIEID